VTGAAFADRDRGSVGPEHSRPVGDLHDPAATTTTGGRAPTTSADDDHPHVHQRRGLGPHSVIGELADHPVIGDRIRCGHANRSITNTTPLPPRPPPDTPYPMLYAL